MIHQAAGGVGTAASQLCRSVGGVTTYGTASKAKHEYVRHNGCDHPIDYHSVDYVKEVRRLTDGRGVDCVLDALGGDDWKKGYSLLRPGGLLISFGWANMAKYGKRRMTHVLGEFTHVPWWTPMRLMQENKGVAGVNMGHLWDERELTFDAFTALLELYEQRQHQAARRPLLSLWIGRGSACVHRGWPKHREGPTDAIAMPVRVCFVCLGNICRSPTAEATMRQLLEREQLSGEIEIDSAGTGDWHVGEPPDRRATAAGKRRGIELTGRARRVVPKDFERFDYSSRWIARTSATSCGWRPTRRPRRRSFSSGTTIPARRAMPTCPTRTTARATVSRPCSTSAKRRHAGCCNTSERIIGYDPGACARRSSNGSASRYAAQSAWVAGTSTMPSKLRSATGRSVFVKTHPNPPAGMFEAEARGLRWLAEADAIRTPRVLAVSDERPAFLALELLTPAKRRADFDETLGRSLAALHAFGAPSFGLDHDNFIGRLAQSNAVSRRLGVLLLVVATRAAAEACRRPRLDRFRDAFALRRLAARSSRARRRGRASVTPTRRPLGRKPARR